MPADPIGSAWAKYRWANKHMERVQDLALRTLDSDIHSVALEVQIEPHGTGATVMVRIEDLPSFGIELGLALGDVFQNFRAALDHLAWGLVKVGTDPRPAKPERVYFPMAKTGKSFRGQIDEWLPGVPNEYRALIRRYQPYRRGERPQAMRWLRGFSTMDKHRVLVPAVFNHTDPNVSVASNWPITRLRWLLREPCALHVGTPVLALELARVGMADCQLQVNGSAAMFPSLGRGVPLNEALARIRDTVLEILGTFDELL